MGRTPTKSDSYFHCDRRPYANRSIDKGLKNGIITKGDEAYIREFIGDLCAEKSISVWRQNKLATHLVSWRRYIPQYDIATIGDLTAGIRELQHTDSPETGKPYAQNTLVDYIKILKQFYAWMIENGYTSIEERRLKKIRSPSKNRMVRTAADILTTEEVRAFFDACRSVRDKALFTVLYEGGFRIGEIGLLTWGQLRWDATGIAVNTDGKTGRPRYIRLVMSQQPLAQWRAMYPFPEVPEGLVFLNRNNKPMSYAVIVKQMARIAERAGITKHITPHLWRHSRITHLVQEDFPEHSIGIMMWGDPTARELRTYLHLTGKDVDRAVLDHYGIKDKDDIVDDTLHPVQCQQCATISPPGTNFCPNCGAGLNKRAIGSVGAAKEDIHEHPDVMMDTIKFNFPGKNGK